MSNAKRNYARPPQWVEDFYNAKELPQHFLVSAANDSPASYLVRPVVMDKVSLLDIDLHNGTDSLPTLDEGSYTIYAANDGELYQELKKGKCFFLTREVQHRFKGTSHSFILPRMYNNQFNYAAGTFAAYRSFVKAASRFVRDKEQVAAAYEFINNHPMFWHFEKHPKSGEKFIVEGTGFSRLDFTVFPAKGGKGSVVTIETGPGSYHDLNLDVFEPTFDEAIISMAKLIHENYGLHGEFRDETKKEPNDNLV